MGRLHTSHRSIKMNVHNNSAKKVTRESRPDIRCAVTVFECIFCRTSHYMESSSGRFQDAHKAINDLLDAGCNKCGGRVTFKEHRHIKDDAFNGRR